MKSNLIEVFYSLNRYITYFKILIIINSINCINQLKSNDKYSGGGITIGIQKGIISRRLTFTELDSLANSEYLAVHIVHS